MLEGLDSIGVKSFGAFNLFVGDDKDQELSLGNVSLDLEGLSELSGIDPRKLLAIIKKKDFHFDQHIIEEAKKIKSIPGNSYSRSYVEEMSKALVCINYMKRMIKEAGGYDLSLKYTSKMLGVDMTDLIPRVDLIQPDVVELKNERDIISSHQVIVSAYGNKDSISIPGWGLISKVGRIIGVKDEAGKIIGVLGILNFQKDYLIHGFSISKLFKNANISKTLLDKTVEYAGTNGIWVGRSMGILWTLNRLIAREFTGTYLIQNFFEKSKPMIWFYYKKDRKKEIDESTLKNTLKIRSNDVERIEKAINEEGFELYCIEKDDNGDPLVRLEKFPDKPDMPLDELDLEIYFDNHRIKRVRTGDEARQACEFCRKRRALFGKDPALARITAAIGFLIHVKDEKDNDACVFSGLYNRSKSFLCHTLITKTPDQLKMGVRILDKIENELKRKNVEDIEILVEWSNIDLLEWILNHRGYLGDPILYKPVGYDNPYFILRKKVGSKIIEPSSDEETVTISKYSDLMGTERSIFVDAKDRHLIELLYREEFNLKSVKKLKIGTIEKLFLHMERIIV